MTQTTSRQPTSRTKRHANGNGAAAKNPMEQDVKRLLKDVQKLGVEVKDFLVENQPRLQKFLEDASGDLDGVRKAWRDVAKSGLRIVESSRRSLR